MLFFPQRIDIAGERHDFRARVIEIVPEDVALTPQRSQEAITKEEEDEDKDEEFQVVKSERTKKHEKRERKREEKVGGTINVLQAVMPPGVNAIGEGEWEEIDMAVDSAATETVVNSDMLATVDIMEGEAFRKGVQYEVASGT